MPELVTSVEATLKTPLVVPEKTGTKVRVRSCYVIYDVADAEGVPLGSKNLDIPEETVFADATLKASLLKYAEADVPNLNL